MEEKRRLPSWMVGASSNNKVSRPLDPDSSSVITSDEVSVSVVTKSTKSKSKGVTQALEKDVCLSSNENVLVKCGTKRKKRGFVEKVVIERRKHGRVRRKPEESNPLRKNKAKNYEFDGGNENQPLSCDEEDDDLTMDDVLSIAKEFVENDKRDKGQQKPSEVQCQLRSKPPYATSPMHEETHSHHEPVETTSKVALTDSKMTGDPVQDMLDLFLGPLLKKPITKEEPSSTNDIIIPHEIKNQQDVAVISNKPVTLRKKKSSLRDAVAMLRD